MEAKLHPTVAQIFTESLSLIDRSFDRYPVTWKANRLQSYDVNGTVEFCTHW